MKVRIVFEREFEFSRVDGMPEGGGKLVFKGFFGEDGEPLDEALIDGEGWIADGDVEAFDMDVWSK